MTFTTSPVVSGDEVMCINEQGGVFILDAGGEFKLKRSFESKIQCKATPAFTGDGMMYIRSKKSIYCVAGGVIDG